MADDPLRQMYPEILWAPYFDRGKFRYWETVGRGRYKIGKDGRPRSELYTDRHISGGSNWFRLLPPGEEPDEQPGTETAEQPKRPSQPGSDADPE
jgi:hypothetical protein